MGKSSLQHLYGLTILLVLFTLGSVLHRHLPLCYTASFAHTWCDPARGARWHHFLPLSKYIPPFRSTGKKKQTHAVGSCFYNQRCKNRHALIDLFRFGWMLVLRFSSPMQLVLGFLPLLEVTTLIKTTVTGRHSLLQTVATVLLLHIHFLIPFCLSGTVSTCVYWTVPPALWRASPFFLYWVSWPMNKEWIFLK